MENSSTLQTTIVINGHVAASLAKALNQVERQTKQTAKHMDGLGSVFKTGLAIFGVGALAYEVKELGFAGIETASNLAEVQNVVDVTFGKSAEVVDSWSETTLKAYGLSELQAKQFSGTMGAMLKSSGLTGDNMIAMSTHLTELAGDMASFYNLDHDLAWEKIRSGISGETEPLKQLGINMSVANLEAFALSKGIKTQYQNMDQASQTALRYAYLMDVTKDAQGDFARTQGGFANQTRLLKTNIEQISGKFMSAFLPALTDGASIANDFMDSLDAEKIKEFSDKVIEAAGSAYWIGTVIAEHWKDIAPVILGIASATAIWNFQMAISNEQTAIGMGIKALSAAWEYATTVIALMREGTSLAAIAQMELNLAMSTNPIGLVVIGIGILVAAIAWLYFHWDKVVVALENGWNWFTNLLDTIPDFALVLAGPLAPILLLIKHFKEVIDFATKGIDAVKNFLGLGDGKAGANYTPAIQGNLSLGMRQYAEGGLATRASIFGEAGPEMAIPIKQNSSRSLRLWQDTGRMIGAVSKTAMQIVYSPNISAGNVQGVKQALQDDFERFKAWAEQYYGDQARVAF